MSAPPPGFPFYPLANPKGVEYKCEICEKPAYLQCSLCRVTYYCGTEHQKLDWVGIHEQMCSNLMKIRKPVQFMASDDERKKHEAELRETMVDMVGSIRTTAQKLLFEGRPEEAIPAGLQCLKLTSDIYGLASVELVLPYLILAESSVGLGRLCQAETYLAQAQWTLLKTKHESSNQIRSQLYRKLALLYSAKGEYDLALESLAKDIFYSSCEYGTDHIVTAGGYFQMADVYATLHKIGEPERLKKAAKDSKSMGLTGPSATARINIPSPVSPSENPAKIYDCRCGAPTCKDTCPMQSAEPIQPPSDKGSVADTLYARVVNIWADHMAGIVKSMTYRPVVPEGIGAVVAEITHPPVETLNVAQKAEAEKVLRAIENYRHQRLINDGAAKLAHHLGSPDPKVRLFIALSMLNFILNRKHEAIQYYSEAKVANEFAIPHEKLKQDIELMRSALEDRDAPCKGATV